MIDLEELHPSVQELIVETLGAEKMERIGRFFQRCGRQAGDGEVRAGCTEEDLRTIWRETALSTSDSLH